MKNQSPKNGKTRNYIIELQKENMNLSGQNFVLNFIIKESIGIVKTKIMRFYNEGNYILCLEDLYYIMNMLEKYKEVE